MKKYILIFALSFICIHVANASDPAFEKAMSKQIQAMATIQTLEESQKVSNSFLRISEAQPEEWLPLYYASLLQIESAFRFDINKDQAFDQALEYIEKAKKIAPENSELTALEGYAVMGKLSVDPANRGQNLTPEAMQLFGKAIALDRENPRAVLLMAQMELGMAQFFGSGPEKACGVARMGSDLLQKEKGKINESYILPTWGERMASQFEKVCQ
ncbi:tetratricopeptide repeat protein [Algoriphagus pacificus]|uniref:Tetratricopeptide repeat-containing protein n=1 Tax=Algoriphagus pacificus TaxID=2811234 RepID=A0ABS3CBP6_9BACT|nr:hypothetical protein [Algoriphagus pacificus]MBN7814527.1 hypothetical protein [Algoriphagus pacificus]